MQVSISRRDVISQPLPAESPYIRSGVATSTYATAGKATSSTMHRRRLLFIPDLAP